MKTQIFVITLLVVSSCIDKSDKVSHIDSSSNAYVQSNVDTVYYTESKSNVVELSPTQYANQIIRGQIKPSDNEQTFAWLDSLHSNNRDTRNYAFKVYKVIVVKSDGALSEAIGEYIKEYFSSYPKEFLDNYRSLDDQERASTSESLAFEFYADGEDNTGDLEIYFKSIKSVCTACTPADKIFLKEIRSTLDAKVRQMHE